MASRGGRGGRGGARGGRGGARIIAGQEVTWDLSGIEEYIQKKPGETFPPTAPARAPPPTPGETAMVQHYLAIRDRIHDGPYYTALNDGRKTSIKRKASDSAPTEIELFNPFVDNQTWSSRYMKRQRRMPKLDARPYAIEFFPPELHSSMGINASTKKRALVVDVTVKKNLFDKKLNSLLKDAEDAQARAEEEEDEDEMEPEPEPEPEEEPDDDDDDKSSALSNGSEDPDDDYNAEQYFDNGEGDDLDDDPYENAYD